MRKLILFCLLLFIGVFCSACVNSFAVYELNEKAMELMDAGDSEGAIARWESIIDLDPNVYEARYNLANAYIGANKCETALEHALVAEKVSKKEPLANYILAVAYDCAANQLLETKDEEGQIIKKEFSTKENEINAVKKYIDYLENAEKNYDIYVTEIKNTEDSDDIVKKISEIKQTISIKKEEYKTQL